MKLPNCSFNLRLLKMKWSTLKLVGRQCTTWLTNVLGVTDRAELLKKLPTYKNTTNIYFIQFCFLGLFFV